MGSLWRKFRVLPNVQEWNSSMLLWFSTIRSRATRFQGKTVIIGALGYLISPLDVIPDAIPIAGLSDDLAVLIYVLHKVWGDVSEEVKAKAKAKLAMWFDMDEIENVNDIFDNNNTDENPVWMNSLFQQKHKH